MKYILICRCPIKCPLGLYKADCDKRNKHICLNCQWSEEIEEQKYPGLGRM